MKLVRTLLALALFAPVTLAQEPPKPGPEHEVLKKHVGDWDYVMKFGGMETKGKHSAKMELGGLWLVGTYEGELFGQKFEGRGLDSYDAAKKKYVGVWFDNMTTTPMHMEGSFDKEKKTMTMSGETTGMDGKPTKSKMVTEWKDDDNFVATMYMGDAKEPAFTITYKRKK